MKTQTKPISVQLPRDPKTGHSTFGSLTALAAVLVALLLGLGMTASAVVLDDFNDNIKTAWTDTANGGSVTEAGSVFTITSTTTTGVLASSKKTSATLTNAAGHTIELRVGVNSISPGATPNGHAVLGWVPSGVLLSSGYSLSVGTNDITISRAGGGASYTTNLATGLQSTNLVLVLRLTPSGASVDVRGSVYKKGPGNYTLLFEYTLNDPVGLSGNGNAALGALNEPSGAAVSVVFDNLEAFDILNSQFTYGFTAPRLPEISLGNSAFATADGWIDLRLAGAIDNTTVPGELAIFSAGAPATFLNATYYPGKTFKISDGSRLEFQVDVKTGSDNPVIVPIISYLPNGLPDLFSLATYFIGQGAGLIAAGKSATTEWVPNSVFTLKNSNVRFIEIMSGEGTAVRLEQRIEDLDVPVNDPARVLFQTAYLDSADTYINKNGYFCVLVYHDNTAGANPNMCTFDNALVNQTAPGNAPPIIGSVTPGSGKAFFAATNLVTFTVADDVNTPLANIVLTLNGVLYTNGHPSVTITPSGSTSTFRTFTLTNLTANVFYDGTISATDNVGANTTMHYEFDTFSTTNLQVEIEEYNFTTNSGLNAGIFIDNAPVVAEATGPTEPASFYEGQVGTAEVDFHDNRGSTVDGGLEDHTFRLDAPKTAHTSDGPRPKYVAVPGSFETLVHELRDGDWLNYTRTYPAGTYNVFLRQSDYRLPQAYATLGRVAGDPSTTFQTNSVLGSFVQLGDLAGDTGFDSHRNVPLTDGSGNRVVVRFTGAVETLRLTDVTIDDGDANVFQNYLVFVPVADPGTLRPIVATVSPLVGATQRQSPEKEATSASIVNRETSVDLTFTPTLTINGVAVASTTTATADGANVAWSLAALPGNPSFTNMIVFKDSAGFFLTNTWSYRYPFLPASNRLPLGSLTVRGFDYRMVHTDNGGIELGDSLIVAEQQVAIPPEIPFELTYSSNGLPTLDWEGAFPNPAFPGWELIQEQGQNYKNTAAEIFGYMELPAGAHRFYVRSDKGFELRSGKSPQDLNAVVLCRIDGDDYDGTFDFVAEADGLYPLRFIWYEEDGSAAILHFKSVKLSDNSQVLVNDLSDPAGGVRVFSPSGPAVVLVSSSTVTGTYTTEPGAVIDQIAKTVTVPISGSMRFYRMSSPSAVTIQSITIVGSNVVITYL